MNPLQYKYPILVTALLLTLLAGYFIPQMKAKYDLEDFFADDDPSLKFYEKHRAEFASDEDVILVAVHREESILDSVFLEKIERLRKDLRNTKNIKRVTSITNAEQLKKTPFGMVAKPILDLKKIDSVKDSIRLSKESLVSNLLISNDLRTACLVVELEASVPEKEDAPLIHAIEKACQVFDQNNIHIGGDTNTQVQYIQMLEKENVQIIPLFILVVVMVLIFLYRSFLSVLIPMISVLLGLIFLYGYAAAVGRNLNISTLMFPTVMAVVGMSDLIHLYDRFLDKMREGLPQKKAILSALHEVRKSLLLTSLTTVIGFLTLSQSSIPHVSTFGWDAAVGVIMAFVIAITFTPVVLSMLSIKPHIYQQKKIKDFWKKMLDSIFNFTKNKSEIVIVITLLFLVFAAWGISQVNTNNYLLGSISNNAKVKKDYLFFEKELAGIRSYELAIETKNGAKITDLKILKDIEKVENYLKENHDFKTIFSPASLFKTAYRIYKSGQLKYHKLPDNQRLIPRLQKMLKDAPVDKFINKDETKGRLSTRMEDVGRLGMKAINQDLQQYIYNSIDTSIMSFTPTGKELLIDQNNEYLMYEMLSSIALAFLLVSIVMAYLFRNIRMVLISLIPNLIPLLLTGGVMGLLGVELNGSTSIIFIISFVIAVDDTIHFLSRFRLEKLNGQTTDEAIYNTFHSTGKAIITTSIILTTGYAVTIFSDFREAYYHGILICWTLIFATLADLFLLPVLLRKFLK